MPRPKLTRDLAIDTLGLGGVAGIALSVGLYDWRMVPGVLGVFALVAAMFAMREKPKPPARPPGKMAVTI